MWGPVFPLNLKKSFPYVSWAFHGDRHIGSKQFLCTWYYWGGRSHVSSGPQITPSCTKWGVWVLKCFPWSCLEFSLNAFCWKKKGVEILPWMWHLGMCLQRTALRCASRWKQNNTCYFCKSKEGNSIWQEMVELHIASEHCVLPYLLLPKMHEVIGPYILIHVILHTESL